MSQMLTFFSRGKVETRFNNGIPSIVLHHARVTLGNNGCEHIISSVLLRKD